MGHEHRWMELTEHSHPTSEEQLEDLESLLQTALFDERLPQEAACSESRRMIVTQALRHRNDIALKLADVDLSQFCGGTDEVEPAREHIRMSHPEQSLAVCKQCLVKCDRRLTSPCQLVQLSNVPPRLQRLWVFRAQHTTAISEKSLPHKERLFGPTTPTDASQQVAPSDEGLRVIGSQPIAAEFGHAPEDRLGLGVEPRLRQRSPEQTAQIQRALTVGALERRVAVDEKSEVRDCSGWVAVVDLALR